MAMKWGAFPFALALHSYRKPPALRTLLANRLVSPSGSTSCPWLTQAISPAIPLYNGVVFLFVLANFSMATFMDPGMFPRGQ
ncbi:hypothetical protein Z043-120885 [Arapaima gigas]